MSLFRIMDIAGTAMNAQSVRLNATASNLANAESVSSSVETTYKARRPLFSAAFDEAMQFENTEGGVCDPVTGEPYGIGVALKGVVESDENGYIYRPNVNPVEEMADMISANRSYQTAVQVAANAKKMMMATLQLGANSSL